jgi:hypothetical protein
MDEDISAHFGEEEFIALEFVLTQKNGLKAFGCKDPTGVVDPAIYHVVQENPFYMTGSVLKQQIIEARKMRAEIVKLREELAALKKMMEPLANAL